MVIKKNNMINFKLKALLLTILTLIGFSAFGFIFYKFQTQTLYTIIGIIVLMFVRHTYVAIDYLISKR